MRLVIEVCPYNNKKARVKLEDGFTFALYKGEIRRLHIKENEYISEDTLDTVMNEILKKRARERALYILKDSSKTKKQIVDKLKKDFYPDEIIDNVISFLTNYCYIDDFSYAENYVEHNIKRKSIMRIKNDLYIKGVSKDIIERVLHESEISEEESIAILINKKIHKYDLNDGKDRRRFYALLQRNGYSHDTILKAFKKVCAESGFGSCYNLT